MSNKNIGWQQKYHIQKFAGYNTCGCREAGCNCVVKATPIFEDVDPKATYFVLRLDTDPHARIAAIAYAESVQYENNKFAKDILNKIEEVKQ